MGTPLGDFLRASRDATAPEDVDLDPTRGRRRAPGLRRAELAALAGISVEYLTRIEQGRDRRPSPPVVNALADALRLDDAEREHLRHLTKITGGSCVGARARPGRRVRPGTLRVLDALEPGVAAVVNALGEILAYTRGFEAIARPTGLLDDPSPSLTRFLFTDPRAYTVFPDWERMADEQAFALSCSPDAEESHALRAELSAVAGDAFTSRAARHRLPALGVVRWTVPGSGELRFERELLAIAPADAQQLSILLPADTATTETVAGILRAGGQALRAVS
jgi:transcriptional regulator with XRE-family HTH domain